jgi:hypothetical protein
MPSQQSTMNTNNSDTTEPMDISMGSINKQGSAKNTTTWFVFIPLGRLWSLVGPGGAGGAVVQVTQNDAHCFFFFFLVLANPT